jgi:hypothetical protein
LVTVTVELTRIAEAIGARSIHSCSGTTDGIAYLAVARDETFVLDA